MITTADIHYEVAHIYPYALGNKRDDSRVKHLWNVLRTFWTSEQIERWWHDALGRQGSPEEQMGTERAHNVLCLAPTVHKYWDNARFALKPKYRAPNGEFMIVEFYWLPIHDRQERSSIVTPPRSSVRPSIGGELEVMEPLH